MLDSILIAGHDDGGGRVDRTCQRLGLEVASSETLEGTRWSPNVTSAVEAAQRAGTKALHPGSSSPAAQVALRAAADQAELIFVGPNPAALEVLQDKFSMRERAQEVGLRTLPAARVVAGDPEATRRAADQVGYPLMVKPVAGCGGVGVHRVEDEDELGPQVTRAEQEAEAAFGDSHLYVERALRRPRQLDITVLSDATGKRVALPERESSFRHAGGALIAETPSPLTLSEGSRESLRDALLESATMFSEHLELVGIVTLELLYDEAGDLFFLEANGGASGTSSASEMLLDVDLVELELRIASGEPLPEMVKRPMSGHAFHSTLRVGRAKDRFTAAEGVLETVRVPPVPISKARVEVAVDAGHRFSASEPAGPVGQVTTRGPTRHRALLLMDRILAETTLDPVPTNLAFLRTALNDEAFRFGQYDTALAERLADQKQEAAK